LYLNFSGIPDFFRYPRKLVSGKKAREGCLFLDNIYNHLLLYIKIKKIAAGVSFAYLNIYICIYSFAKNRWESRIMKKILFASVVAGSLLFAGAGSAMATLISYTYTDTHAVNLLMAKNTATENFNYSYYLSVPLIGSHPDPSPVYVPGTDVFITASLVLYFSGYSVDPVPRMNHT
jgi:hypothetical protein